jgi:hypothetical protein
MAERQHKRQPRMNRDLARAAQDAREQANHDRMEALLAQVVRNSKPLEEEPAATLAVIEESRLVAMHCHPPQMAAAIAACRLRSEILGLIVKRTAVKVIGNASQQDFPDDADEEMIYEHLRQHIGSVHADRFRIYVESTKAIARGDIIDGDAEGTDE